MAALRISVAVDHAEYFGNRESAMRVAILVLAALFVSGCLNRSISSFDPPADKSYFILNDDVWVPDVGGLKKGRYSVAFEDINYIYFLGENPQSLWLGTFDGIDTVVGGGIGLPKGGQYPVLFIRVGDDSEAIAKSGAGYLPSVMSKLETGRIRVLKQKPASAQFQKYIKVIRQ